MESNFYGSRIKAGRRRLGLSVDQFAERLGVSRATQMNYESGKTLPSVAYVDQCARNGIAPSSLLSITDGFGMRLDALGDGVAVELFRLLDDPSLEVVSTDGRARLFESLLRLLRKVGVGDRLDPASETASAP